MFLKSIEIQGFKSFAVKTVLLFHEGVTGIVGPNGSGKSNIADAVRWVLGEQSVKQLRGGSMQDVIFSGTQTRKPLSYAYVAITLDNSDHALNISYEEVTVARRLYRSGESEYLLNGSPCRLKDVNELFFDTGIGKEGYSIIGQGQIDKILSGKPEERRELFDEAAGIVKFKYRKSAALKKLDNEQNNLVRVNDILAELERQIGPLERQSAKAKEWLKYKEELKTIDVNSFLLENETLKKAVTDLQGRLDVASADLDTASGEYNKVKEDYNSVQMEMEDLEEAIEKARELVSGADSNRQKLESSIELLKEQIKSSKDNITHFSERKEALLGEIEKYNAEKDSILQDSESEEEQAQKVETEATARKEALDKAQEEIQDLNTRIEETATGIMDELKKRSEIQGRISHYTAVIQQIELRKAELQSKLLRARSDEEAREDSIKQYEEAFEKVSAEIAEMNKNATELEAKVAELRSSLSSKDEQLRSLQEEYHKENSRYQALEDIAEAYEGYGNSVKKIMEQKKSVPGIIGVVADIIKVDKKYETAIEMALGGNIQNIVTKDEATAKKMIGFLKEGRLGRATFLPLDSVKDPQELKAKDALNEKGMIGLASDLVETDDEYRNVIKSLLGRFIVADNMDNATKAARKFNYTLRVVTLEGELLMPGGSITGGAFKNNNNFLGKSREIGDLKKKVAKLSADIEKLKAEIDETRENRNTSRAELDKMKLDIQNKVIEQNTARLTLQAERDRFDEESENAVNLKQEQQDIEKEMVDAANARDEAAEVLKSSESNEKRLREEEADLNEMLRDKQAVESEAAARVNEWEVEVQKMKQAKDFKQANLNRVEESLAGANNELESLNNSIETNNTAISEKEVQIEEIRKTIDASYEEQEKSADLLKNSLSRKEALTEKQKGFFENTEKLQEKMSSLDKEVNRLTAQRDKANETMEIRINYMWQEYEITLSQAAEMRDESLNDLTVLKRDAAEVRDKIKKLGDVNVGAIEEYKNVSERYESMKTQHDDLIEAADTLKKIIEELDENMRTQFSEKFKLINEEYDKVFKELFGGGSGSLSLQDDEDILECGINISAQPPGKKLQNMMQLSGGEKALSAIALLFAIQNLKPSPFCLLDEIEAALDDNNVGRFAKYLHKLTKNTQFICITHRRGTMEQVDRLYGITMQEKGVSSQVAVNMIESELDD